MFNIKDFLVRIKGLQAKEHLIKSSIQEAVKKNIDLDVSSEAICISGSTVILNKISQSARSALFIKKDIILEDINERQQARLISDIK